MGQGTISPNTAISSETAIAVFGNWTRLIMKMNNHRVGVILKGPEPSPLRRFPSDVKRFRPSINNVCRAAVTNANWNQRRGVIL